MEKGKRYPNWDIGSVARRTAFLAWRVDFKCPHGKVKDITGAADGGDLAKQICR